MTRDGGLTPFGAATARFFASREGGPRPPAGARLTETLMRRVRAHDLPEEVVTMAWELARLEPGLDDKDARGLLYLCTIALLDLRRGSTRTPARGEAGRAHLTGVLEAWVPDAEERAIVLQDIQWVLEQRRARTLIAESPDAYTPLVLVGDHLYLQRMLRLEERLVSAIVARATGGEPVPEAHLEDVLARPAFAEDRPVTLSEEQRSAVARALGANLLVISGGPGTGKTSIVVAILRALVRAGVGADEVALAAPTGKAAQRMSEAVRRGLEAVRDPSPEDLALVARAPAPTTLHRLLGYLPSHDRFAHHENNRLAERVVIVDEASMIDLELMERLFRAARDDGRVILLGDAQQLPSVEAGAVLRDVRAARAQISVQLTQSFRMREDDPAGRQILLAARAINAGAVAELLGDREEQGRLRVVSRVEDVPGAGVTLLAGEDPLPLARRLLDPWEAALWTEDLERDARRLYHYRDGAFRPEDLEPLARLEAALGARKLLCITKNPGFPTGADAMNRLVHQRRVAREGLEGNPDLLPGEPVMMLLNDYSRGLFNGDQGVVLRVAVDQEAATPMVVFRTEAGFSPYPLSQLRPKLALAHAMTVHKAQGSEMDHVVVLLPDRDLPLLTRELLYTAVTRAKRSVTLVGHPELLARAVRRTVVRHSGVADELGARLEEVHP